MRVVGHGPVIHTLLGMGAVGLAANAAPARAQAVDPGELAALRQQIAALQARLDKLESVQKAAPQSVTAPTPVVSGSKLPVTLSGLLQVNARGFSSQSGPGANSVNTFQLRRGELRVTGNISDRLTGMIMIDPAKQTAAASTSTVVGPKAGSPPGTLPTVTTVTTLNQSTNPLQEIVLTYLLARTKSNANFIDLGQYKIPIGYEGDLVPSGAIPTVDRGLIYQARDPFGGGNGDIRDTGVRLRGTAGLVDYQVGVFNGLGERQNALAAGDPKAFVGRLMFGLRHISGLQLGISGAQGNTRNIPVNGSRAERDLFNAFVNYKRDKLGLRAEYLTGNNQILAAAPGVTRDIRGYYGLATYAFTPKVEGVLRYDYFDFARNLIPAAGASGDTTVTESILGINYYIKGNNAKIQANLVRHEGGAGLLGINGFGSNATAFSKTATQLRTNFQLAF